jgi:nucleotide-binding universal stress UspA family protein
MSLKDILVYADTAACAASRLDVAAGLAARYQAHLTALHVSAHMYLPGYVVAELPPSVLEMHRGHLKEAAERAEKLARERAKRAGVELEWRRVDAAAADAAARARLHAHHADLIVVSQTAEGEVGGLAGGPDLVEALVLGSGRPVLAVPRYGTFATVGERVLIAWTATREAARSVNDALPLLKRAKEVTVLSVNPPSGEAPRIAGADIALHLARHGVKATAATTRAEDLDVGDALLSRAADLGTDLLVMGAYGHSRTREIVLGGATRHLLQYMTIPVLMSH